MIWAIDGTALITTPPFSGRKSEYYTLTESIAESDSHSSTSGKEELDDNEVDHEYEHQ